MANLMYYYLCRFILMFLVAGYASDRVFYVLLNAELVEFTYGIATTEVCSIFAAG